MTYKLLLLASIAVMLPTFNFSIEPDWSPYDKVLKIAITPKVVENIPIAYVDYKKVYQHPQWKQIVSTIENYPYEQLKTKHERAAFLINAYNIHILNLIAKRKKSSSILTIINVFKSKSRKVAKQMYSLDQIEVELRKNIDARFHFAIVCAALSCPDLDNQAYNAKDLHQQLERVTKNFLTNTQKGVQVRNNTKKIHASKLLHWYKKDFEKKWGSIKNFLQIYYPTLPLSTHEIKVDLKYIWKINGSVK